MDRWSIVSQRKWVFDLMFIFSSKKEKKEKKKKDLMCIFINAIIEGCVGFAGKLFDEMSQRDLVSWMSMI